MNLQVPIVTESNLMKNLPSNVSKGVYLKYLLEGKEDEGISLYKIYENYLNSPEYRLMDAIKSDDVCTSVILERIKANNEKLYNKDVKQLNEVMDELTCVFLCTLTIIDQIDRYFPGMMKERIFKSFEKAADKGWVFKNTLRMEWD